MQRVLVTGANRGLGLEFVRELLARGDRVFAACRHPGRALALTGLAAAHPGHLVTGEARLQHLRGKGLLDTVLDATGPRFRDESIASCWSRGSLPLQSSDSADLEP